MSSWLSILVSLITAFLTTIGFIYLRIYYFRFRYGPAVKRRNKIKIQRENGSDKVYIIKSGTKKWVHPKESLDRLGYDLNEDVEQVAAKSLDKYREKADINLTY